jgi:hypothetical protein
LQRGHERRASRTPRTRAKICEVLNGKRKARRGLISPQGFRLHNPNGMAAAALKNVLVSLLLPPSDGGLPRRSPRMTRSPGRAVAYKVLARDRDPATTKGLTDAACEKGWPVQTGVPEALARRGERSALSTEKYMSDEKDKVRYSATAAVPLT